MPALPPGGRFSQGLARGYSCASSILPSSRIMTLLILHTKTSLTLELGVHVAIVAAGTVPFRISSKACVIWYLVFISEGSKRWSGSSRRPAVGGCDSPVGGLGISHQPKRTQSKLLLYNCDLFPDPLELLVCLLFSDSRIKLLNFYCRLILQQLR